MVPLVGRLVVLAIPIGMWATLTHVARVPVAPHQRLRDYIVELTYDIRNIINRVRKLR